MTINNLRKRLEFILSKPEYIALYVALMFSVLSAFIVPQMTVNDEGAHLLKSYTLSTGELSGRTCEFPRSIVDESRSSMDKTPPSSSLPVNYNKMTVTSCGSANGYSLIMHIPQAIGMNIAKILNGSPDMLVLFGRIANAIFYSIALFYIIRLAKIGKWVYLVVGLFPISVHAAGSLSADPMNNIIVMLSFAFIINLFTQNNKLKISQILSLLGIVTLLSLTKPTNLVLLLPLAALPIKLFNKNNRFKAPFNLHKWIIIVSVLSMAVVIMLISHLSKIEYILIENVPTSNPLVDNPAKFFYIAYNTYINPFLGYGDLLIRGIVGEFSSFKYHLPTFIVFAQFIALGIALIYTFSNEKRFKVNNLKPLVLLGVTSLILFISAITVVLYSGWAILPKRLGPDAFYADGVQGRYFTAALLSLIPLGVLIRKWFTINASDMLVRSIIVFIIIFSLIFYISETCLILF